MAQLQLRLARLMKKSTFLFSAALTILSVVGSAHARNITIYDGIAGNGTGGGFGAIGIGQGREDQETEPGTLGRQDWDLEAFTLNGTKLSIYSGFNLLAGNPTQNPKYSLGDIFIDIQGTAATPLNTGVFGTTTDASFGYDYIIHFDVRGGTGTDIGTGAYTVYKVVTPAGTILNNSKFVGISDPWTLDVAKSGGNITAVDSGKLAQDDLGLGDVTLDGGPTVVTGGRHYRGDVSLGFLTAGELSNGTTVFHLTQECGNDRLVGRVADGGSTLALLGSALTALSFVMRRSRKA